MFTRGTFFNGLSAYINPGSGQLSLGSYQKKEMEKMVDSECPILKIVAIHDGPLSDRLKASVPLSLCVHLRDKGLSFGDTVWTAKQSKSEFSSFYWDKCKTGTVKTDSIENIKRSPIRQSKSSLYARFTK